MRGTLCVGDIVCVDNVPLQSIDPGDVVVYARQSTGGRKTIHRVQSHSFAGIVTQGDNCPKSDPYKITETEFIGRVSFATRNGKRIRISGGRTGLLRGRSLRAL